MRAEVGQHLTQRSGHQPCPLAFAGSRVSAVNVQKCAVCGEAMRVTRRPIESLTNLSPAMTYRSEEIAAAAPVGLAAQVQFHSHEKRPYKICDQPSSCIVLDPSNRAAFSAGAASCPEFPANASFELWPQQWGHFFVRHVAGFWSIRLRRRCGRRRLLCGQRS